MSAAEILEQLKTLSSTEQAAFDRLLRQWKSAPESPKSVTHQWPDFLARLRKIYGNKVAGDGQSLISELRDGR